ncbi:hypothetical protein FA10DRAFT_171579 [Acaromyces ingoldii]|uniref:Uncharacterized protein n=1 Tax=Acaromyces ingoldii TaxID=215250 RepID=A0A316YJB3_9BASI|nr:hypothetical protein FA10DRAFT_171579 [Acaromyces ingoldii]PWN88708.1 hypothetical protein FA10DRAFT_171579 [Acaromyces ingoldii]
MQRGCCAARKSTRPFSASSSSPLPFSATRSCTTGTAVRITTSKGTRRRRRRRCCAMSTSASSSSSPPCSACFSPAACMPSASRPPPLLLSPPIAERAADSGEQGPTREHEQGNDGHEWVRVTRRPSADRRNRRRGENASA